jgi:hypothetical protein
VTEIKTVAKTPVNFEPKELDLDDLDDFIPSNAPPRRMRKNEYNNFIKKIYLLSFE